MERLSQAEQYVMAVIWSNKCNDLQLYTLSEKVSQRFGRTWKAQTTATFISRLQKKNYVTTYKKDNDRFTYYKPLVTLDDYRKEMLQELQDICFEDRKEMKQYLKEYCK